MTPDDPRHGTTRGYHAGCHEACCRRAMARYEKAGRLARLRGGRAIPAIGAQRRLQALMRLGWSSHRIATEAGLPHRNHVWRILHGQNGKPTTWIQRDTYEWVCAVYERLSMQVPSGRYVARTRTFAEGKGWPPPLAWDNIDDPNETPAGAYEPHRHRAEVDEAVVCRVMAGERLHTTPAEKAEVLRRWRAAGLPVAELERMTGWKRERYSGRAA